MLYFMFWGMFAKFYLEDIIQEKKMQNPAEWHLKVFITFKDFAYFNIIKKGVKILVYISGIL